MKYDYAIKYKGVRYTAGMEVPLTPEEEVLEHSRQIEIKQNQEEFISRCNKNKPYDFKVLSKSLNPQKLN